MEKLIGSTHLPLFWRNDTSISSKTLVHMSLFWPIRHILTYSPAKNQAFALIRKFNFEISSSPVFKLWCLKCIDISLTPIWTPLWGPSGPKVPNMEKPGTLVLNNFRWKGPVMLWHFTSKIFEDVISLKTEKTENFFQILILEFFNCDNLFPGKILSRIQVSHMFWCLVTPKTPRGVTEVTKH